MRKNKRQKNLQMGKSPKTRIVLNLRAFCLWLFVFCEMFTLLAISQRIVMLVTAIMLIRTIPFRNVANKTICVKIPSVLAFLRMLRVSGHYN